MAQHTSIAELAASLGDRLDDRARRVLAAIVRDYVASAEPVGSQALARSPGMDVSAATVRAVMADLEALGLIEKPHTSAGRIPTALGYRFYVDALVRVKQPLPAEQKLIEQRTAHAAQHAQLQLLQEATRLLHTLTRHAAVVASPRPHGERLARIDFVELREGRVLAVLVARSGSVTNRLLLQPAGERMMQPQLDKVANWLNAHLADLTLAEARAKLRDELATDQRALDDLTLRAVGLGTLAVAAEAAVQSVLIEGQASFLEEPSLAADLAKMRALLQALEEKKGLVQVLDKVMAAEELTIFIGHDSGIAEPAEVSIVAAPYRVQGEVVGTLGVIGPTRMDYSRVIPLVELTARTIGAALGD